MSKLLSSEAQFKNNSLLEQETNKLLLYKHKIKEWQANMEESQKEDSQKPGFWAVVFSTFAAAFGVQSKRAQERDFKHGNIWVYIAAGLIFTTLFVLTIYTLVQTVLSTQ